MNPEKLSEKTKNVINNIKQRVKYENKPGGIIISAPPGRGKTTLAVILADYYEEKKINLKEQIANGYEDFMKKFPEAIKKGHKVMIYDEGGDISKRRALTVSNYNILRIYDLFRGYKIFLIHILQNFNMLDRALIDSEVPRALFYINDRNKKRAVYSCYSLKKMYYIKSFMANPKNIIKNKAFLYIPPNFKGIFFDLPYFRREELYNLSIGGKTDILKNLVKKKEEKGVKVPNFDKTFN